MPEATASLPVAASESPTDGPRHAAAIARQFGAPLLDLSAFDLQRCPVNLVDTQLLHKHRVLPLYRRGNRLYLATSDPTRVQAFDELKFHTGLSIDIVVVDDAQLSPLIDRLQQQSENGASLDDMLEEIGVDNPDADSAAAVAETVDEAPVVRFVNRLLLDAVRAGASDIHMEPYEHSYRIRLRSDGILREVSHPPRALASRIASRIKIMARLDISERRLPQDGRIRLKLARNRAIDLRVNTLPTVWGEKLVLRLLDPDNACVGIDLLGYEETQKQLYLTALRRSQGLILVTGPTGSGKTVSLYSGLDLLNTAGINISTAEDPVEINLEGVNQVAVNTRIGLSFASVLRAFLRQDPDVIMVGEIRDLETAEIAIKAAQTGHLVLSTLHTNSAIDTLVRLRNMGIPSYNLASSVSLIMAQRLCRRLCHCKQPQQLPPTVLREAGFAPEQIDSLQLHAPVGCEACSDGYRGRVGIHEVLPVTEGLSRIIMSDGNALQLAEQAAREGYRTLRQSALAKVAQGLTSLAEIERIT